MTLETTAEEQQQSPSKIKLHNVFTLSHKIEDGDVAGAMEALNRAIGAKLKEHESDGAMIVKVTSQSHSIATVPMYGTFLTVIITIASTAGPRFKERVEELRAAGEDVD